MSCAPELSRCGRRWFNRVHHPVLRSWSGFPDVNPQHMGRRECVKVCDGQFCCCVSEVVAPYIGMAPQFVEGSAETNTSPFFEEIYDTTYQEVVVVIVFGTCNAWVCMMMLDSL